MLRARKTDLSGINILTILDLRRPLIVDVKAARGKDLFCECSLMAEGSIIPLGVFHSRKDAMNHG